MEVPQGGTDENNSDELFFERVSRDDYWKRLEAIEKEYAELYKANITQHYDRLTQAGDTGLEPEAPTESERPRPKVGDDDAPAGYVVDVTLDDTVGLRGIQFVVESAHTNDDRPDVVE